MKLINSDYFCCKVLVEKSIDSEFEILVNTKTNIFKHRKKYIQAQKKIYFTLYIQFDKII